MYIKIQIVAESWFIKILENACQSSLQGDVGSTDKEHDLLNRLTPTMMRGIDGMYYSSVAPNILFMYDNITKIRHKNSIYSLLLDIDKDIELENRLLHLSGYYHDNNFYYRLSEFTGIYTLEEFDTGKSCFLQYIYTEGSDKILIKLLYLKLKRLLSGDKCFDVNISAYDPIRDLCYHAKISNSNGTLSCNNGCWLGHITQGYSLSMMEYEKLGIDGPEEGRDFFQNFDFNNNVFFSTEEFGKIIKAKLFDCEVIPKLRIISSIQWNENLSYGDIAMYDDNSKTLDSEFCIDEVNEVTNVQFDWENTEI